MDEEPKLITIDPNGDMLIILKDPDTAQLKWRDESECVDDRTAQAKAETKSEAEAAKETTETESAQIEQEPTPIRYLVSSRQLRIVSPYFENMFKRDYEETVPDSRDNLYHVQAQQWDPEAFTVMLNIAHLQPLAIPNKVSLRLFAGLFVIADYYQMVDTSRLFTAEWLRQLKQQPRPTDYTEESMLWMFLGAKLKDLDMFGSMASIAMMQARHPIQLMDLPLPSSVQKSMDEMRCAAIQELLLSTHKLNQDLYESNVGCEGSCSAMMLGFLQRRLWDAELLDWLREDVQSPFHGIAFATLHQKLNEMDNVYEEYSGDQAGCCDIHEFLGPICARAEARLKFDSEEHI